MDDLTKAALVAGGMYLGYPGASSSAAGADAASTGAYLSAGSGLLTNLFNANRADEANAWSAEQYAKRYQVMTADMKAAGLNPMLAYTQNAGSAPTAQQVTFQNPMSSATQSYQQVASGDQSIASASQAQAQIKQIDATVDKIKEETKNIPVEGDRLRYTVQLLSEQAAKIAQETQNLTVTEKVLGQTVKKLKSETSLLDLDVEAAKLLDNIGRESRQLKPIVDIIRAIK
ncbi:MAG: DNA pilot protein [Arizlama microvirus]|nr:MAG: DNA pilot protein [Arizlama microvirus]